MGETHGGTLKELQDWLSSPPSDYGNHSCDACAVSGNCPVKGFTEDTSAPNPCSFYWPPNADKEPGEWYWGQLYLIAKQIEDRLWIARMKKSILEDRDLLDRILDQ